MPLQNRVLPTGEIVIDPARGMFTGNRGCLHDDQRQLGRARWKGRAWIICALEYKGWRRVVMTPRTWTELFFLDEAVALAAGHRPCALCRRAAFLAYQAGFGGLRAPQMDTVLHGARLDGRGQLRHQAALEGLPDGVFVLVSGQPHLVRGAGLWPYAPAGYGVPVARFDGEVTVLTPAPSVAVLRAGYRPVMA
jgi:hypothetical protein